MNLERFLNDIHIPRQSQILFTSQLLFVLSFVKGCVHLSFEKKFENDLSPTLIANLTHKYCHANIHSGICVHQQYIQNSPISIIMV
jgi:hypothetical protein